MGILINTKSAEAVYRGNDEVSAIYVGSNKVWPETKEYILFLDPEVERICIAEYSSDGIGCTVLDLNSATTLYDFSGNTVIEYFPELKYFTSITNYQILNKFANCTNLKTIEIPNLITQLRSTFSKCSQLSNVVLPQNLNIIDTDCFYLCTSLQNISIPNSVTEIRGRAFLESGLTSVQLPTSLLRMISLSFFDTKIQFVSIPNSVQFIGGVCFKKCSLLRSVTFETGGTTPLLFGSSNLYGSGIFSGCPNLAEVRFPARLNSILDRGLSIAANGSNKSIRYIFEGTTPPAVTGNLFNGGIQLATMYVPDEALEAYKTATGFSTYASSIFPISQLPTT